MRRNMKKLSNERDIWPPSLVTESDIQGALNYATVSLPWTFDRMRYGPRSQKAVNNRLLHILMGVLNQTILERELTKRGYSCSKDWTRYRESDIFDFSIGDTVCDVKTAHLYSQYNDNWGREQFSPSLLIANKSYDGPEWKHFFPMMVTLSQLTVEKEKDSYIFGIAETYEDIRSTMPNLNDGGFWCGAPYGKAFHFFQNTRIIRSREENEMGFNIKISWTRPYPRINGSSGTIRIILYGEWAGFPLMEELTVTEGEQITSENEFSSLSCIRVEQPAILDDNDEIILIAQNHFEQHIPKLTNPTINLNDPTFEWILGKDSFVNLMVPKDYKVFWIGHIPFEEFVSKFTDYPSYFIPHGGGDMEKNDSGRATPKLKQRFESLDRRRKKAIDNGINVPWCEFSSLIEGQKINAGLLLVAMRGPKPIGAACYYYPPYALQESAMYVLPQDLYPMDLL